MGLPLHNQIIIIMENKHKEPEEEIIFPLEEPRKPSKLLKIAVGALVLIAVFMLGYFTSPESLDNSIKSVKAFIFDVKSKILPLEQKAMEVLQAEQPKVETTASKDEKPKRKIK